MDDVRTIHDISDDEDIDDDCMLNIFRLYLGDTRDNTRPKPNLTFKLSGFTCLGRREVRLVVSSFSSEAESCAESPLLPFFCPEDSEQD